MRFRFFKKSKEERLEEDINHITPLIREKITGGSELDIFPIIEGLFNSWVPQPHRETSMINASVAFRNMQSLYGSPKKVADEFIGYLKSNLLKYAQYGGLC